MTNYSIDIPKTAEAVERLGLENVVVKVEPSVVQGSPYDYVYVYLTPEEHTGTHLIVSDAWEWEDRGGYLVGIYPHWEEPGESMHAAEEPDMLAKVKALIKAHREGLETPHDSQSV